MIERTGNSSAQQSLGFENLSRFGPQATSAVEARKAASEEAALSAEQQQQVAKLKQIDQKVRAHEQAHIAVGADLILSGPSYSYETGPDKKRYAVAGEVSIDTSPGRTPAETIPKAQHIRATALAPADPSPEDRRIAAQASQLEGRARQELLAQQHAALASGAQDSSTRLYRAVERSDNPAAQAGGALDLFA